jgi:hypothetical protein
VPWTNEDWDKGPREPDWWLFITLVVVYLVVVLVFY